MRNDLTPDEQELLDYISGPPQMLGREEFNISRAERGYWADRYEFDAISLSSGAESIFGGEALVESLASKYVGYECGIRTTVEEIDVVGDIGVVIGTFRFARQATDETPGLDRRGCFMITMKRGEDGVWRAWRDSDTNSPAGEKYYDNILPGPRWI